MSPVDAGRTMVAARFHGAGDVRLEQVPTPRPRPDEALVEVEWVGLCGSDVEEWRQGPVVVHPPVTLGHEIVGVVRTAAADGSGPWDRHSSRGRRGDGLWPLLLVPTS